MIHRRLTALALLPALLFAPVFLAADTDPGEPLQELLSPEEAEEFRDYLDAHLPEDLPEFLAELREHHPEEADELVHHLFDKMVEYHELTELEPDRAEQFARYNRLEVRSRLLAYRLEETENPEKRETLRDRITETVEEAFSARMELQRARLRDLEKEVAELADLLSRREKARAEIIDRRIADLTGENEHLEW